VSEIPLIAARCKRCRRIAARYWLLDGEGEWLAAAQIRVAVEWAAEAAESEHPRDQMFVWDEQGRVSAAKRDVVARELVGDLRDLHRRVAWAACWRLQSVTFSAVQRAAKCEPRRLTSSPGSKHG
jgi:hypothetical protein